MVMKKNRELKLRQKTFLLIFGAIVAVILIEAGLQVSSFIGSHVFLPRYNFSKIAPGERVVFCLGNSFTYGVGADKDNSYPIQLEGILNKQGSGSRFKVYNMGVPGYNSVQILKKLRAVVSLHKPDVVIVLCGGNDNWNFDGMELQFGDRLMRIIFSRLKIFKMSSIISENMRYMTAKNSAMGAKDRIGTAILKQENNAHKLIQYGNVYRQYGFFAQAQAFYFKAKKNMSNDPLVVLELGRCYKLAQKYNMAIDLLGRGLNNYPNDNKLHDELRDVFIRLKSNKKTILFYREFLLKFPDNLLGRKCLADAYLRVGGEYYLLNKSKGAIEYYNKALVFDPQNKEKINSFMEIIESNEEKREEYLKLNLQAKFYGFSRVMSGYYFTSASGQRIVKDVLEENLDKMVEICRKNNIEIFFSGYPDGLPEAMQRAALSNNIVLIDHKKVFDNLLKQGKNEGFFVSDKDNHCTRSGYKVMAENIAEVILSVISPETEKK